MNKETMEKILRDEFEEVMLDDGEVSAFFGIIVCCMRKGDNNKTDIVPGDYY